MATSPGKLLGGPAVRAGWVALVLTAWLAGCWGSGTGGSSAPSLERLVVVPPNVAPAGLGQAGRAPEVPAWTGELPESLTGATSRSWLYDRISGVGLSSARQKVEAARGPKERALQAFGAQAWGASGVALSALGATGHATNGPCFIYNGPQAGRIWFLTTTGMLVGADKADPTNASAKPGRNPIVVNLGDTVTAGFVSASFDGARLYMVSDSAKLHQVKLTGAGATLTTVSIPALSALPGASTSVGTAAALDPLKSGMANDVIYVGNNAGEFTRFTSNGSDLVAGTTRQGITSTAGLTAPTTRLFAAPPIALNDVLYYGDRAGKMYVFNFVPNTLSPVESGSGYPIECALGLEVDNNLAYTDLFAAAGARVAWFSKATNQVALTRPLLINDLNAGTRPVEGLVRSYTPAAATTTTLSLTTADRSGTVLAATSPAPSGVPMVLPQIDDAGATINNRRARSITSAHIVDAGVPNTKTVYGRSGNCGIALNQVMDARATSATPAQLNGPIGIALTSTGGMFIGAKRDDDEAYGGDCNDSSNDSCQMIRYIPGQNEAGKWGYGGTMNKGFMHIVAGRGTYPAAARPQAPLFSGTNPANTISEPHSLSYMEGTGDLFWAEWQSGHVQRLRPNGTVSLVQDDNNGPHGLAVVGNDVYFVTYNGTYLKRVVAPYGAANVTTVMANISGAANGFTDLWYDPTTNALWTVSRAQNRVYKIQLPGLTTTVYAGGGATRTNGTNRLAFQFSGSESVTVNPETGDVFVAENAGRRIWRIWANTPANGPLADTVELLAGNGGATYAGDGLAGPSQSLGWCACIRLGPPDLSTPTVNPLGSLYLSSRTTASIIRFDFPPEGPGGATGLMRWDYTGTAALVNKPVIEARVTLTCSSPNPTNVGVPRLVQASPNLSGSATLWNLSTITTSNVPAHDLNVAGTPLTSPASWAVGNTLTYNLPAALMPTNGHAAFAMLPRVAASPIPNLGELKYHYPFTTVAVDADDVRAPDFYPGNSGANSPSLALTVASNGMRTPMLSPPAVLSDGTNRFVYVFHTNALFRIPFTANGNTSTFTGAADAVTYAAGNLARANMTRAGFDQANFYYSNPTPPLLTVSGKAYVVDMANTGGTNYSFSVSRFNGLKAPNTGAAPAGILLAGSAAVTGINLGASPPSYSTCTYATYDGYGNDTGFLYFGLRDGKVYRMEM